MKKGQVEKTKTGTAGCIGIIKRRDMKALTKLLINVYASGQRDITIKVKY